MISPDSFSILASVFFFLPAFRSLSTIYNLFFSTSQLFWLIEQLNGKQIEVEKIVMATFIVLRGIALRSFAPFSFKKKKSMNQHFSTARNIWKRRKKFKCPEREGREPKMHSYVHRHSGVTDPKNRQK